MNNGIRNANAVARKLRLASARGTNHRLEVVREERGKKEEMIKRRKIEAMAAKTPKS